MGGAAALSGTNLLISAGTRRGGTVWRRLTSDIGVPERIMLDLHERDAVEVGLVIDRHA